MGSVTVLLPRTCTLAESSPFLAMPVGTASSGVVQLSKMYILKMPTRTRTRSRPELQLGYSLAGGGGGNSGISGSALRTGRAYSGNLVATNHRSERFPALQSRSQSLAPLPSPPECDQVETKG